MSFVRIDRRLRRGLRRARVPRRSARAAAGRWRRASGRCGRARASSAPAFPVKCSTGRQPRDPRRGRGSAGRFGARRERRARTGARLLGRGAHDRRRSARHRRARDRRRRARRRRARGARLPGVLDDDRVARRDQAGARAASAAPRSSATSRSQRGDWIVGDADGVTVVPHAHLDDVLAAGRHAGREGRASSSRSCAPGAPRSNCSSLDDPSPIEPRN